MEDWLTWKYSSLSLALHVTGIDFAGPFELKSSMLQKAPLIKGYVCLFVCFTTKAIHLQTCSELLSTVVEAAFTCFVGRRGLHSVVSDNGRNFIRASRKLLKEFSTFLCTTSNDISTLYPHTRLTWKVSGNSLEKCLSTDLHTNGRSFRLSFNLCSLRRPI